MPVGIPSSASVAAGGLSYGFCAWLLYLYKLDQMLHDVLGPGGQLEWFGGVVGIAVKERSVTG